MRRGLAQADRARTLSSTDERQDLSERPATHVLKHEAAGTLPSWGTGGTTTFTPMLQCSNLRLPCHVLLAVQ